MGLRLKKIVLITAAALSFGVSAWSSDYQILNFDQLAAKSYDPVAPETGKKVFVRKDEAYLKENVLESVLALNGKPVEVAGYMMPISLKGEKVDEFLLMPDTGACCYGAMPAFNGFVFARMKKGANLLDNVPIRVRGKLVVEEVWQSGFFSHLYFIEVDDIAIGFGKLRDFPPIEP